MPPQEPQLNFGGIPRTAGAPAAAPPEPEIPLGTPASASTAGLNFGGIPRLKPAPVTADRPGEIAAIVRGSLAGKVIESYNPKTSAGRMNIGTTLTGLAAAPFTGGTAPWIMRILAPGLVAAGTGAGIETGEQVAGTHPPSTAAALTEGALQAAYEYGGRMLMWPARRLGTYFAAPRVARQAGAGMRAGVEAAQTTATEANDVARAQAEQYLNTVRLAGRGEIRAAQAATGAERAEIERVGAEDLAGLQQQYDALYKAPPSTVQAGRAVAGAVRRETPTAPSVAVTRIVHPSRPVASDKPATWFVRGHLDDAAAARLNDMYTGGKGTVVRGYLPEESARLGQPVGMQGTTELRPSADGLDEFGNTIFAVPTPNVGTFSTLPPKLPRGPSQKALDIAGEKVAEAAATGPRLAVSPLKDSLDRMVETARPAALFAEKPKTPGLGFLQTIRARGSGAAASAGGNVTAAEQTRLQQLIAKELGITEPSHPLPGILGRIAALPDGGTLSFADAHQLKRLLDEGINFNEVSKKHIAQITKGLRGDLRDMLAVHEPYNAATDAYKNVIGLYRRGVGQKLIKAATTDPDSVVPLLDATKPERAASVKRLLVEQSAKGGDAATGWQAWQAVQSAYTYDKILKGGIEGLSQRVAKILTETPEFAKVMFGDDAARRVLSNYDALGTAWNVAEQGLKSDLAEHVVRSGARETAVRDTVADRALAARQAAGATRRATARQGEAEVAGARAKVEAFRQSRTGRVEAQQGGPALDALYASMLPGSYVAARSIMRVLSGPNAAELAQFIGHSPDLTRRVVLALNSRLPDAAVAALIRDLGTIVQTELTPPAAGAQNKSR